MLEECCSRGAVGVFIFWVFCHDWKQLLLARFLVFWEMLQLGGCWHMDIAFVVFWDATVGGLFAYLCSSIWCLNSSTDGWRPPVVSHAGWYACSLLFGVIGYGNGGRIWHGQVTSNHGWSPCAFEWSPGLVNKLISEFLFKDCFLVIWSIFPELYVIVLTQPDVVWICLGDFSMTILLC